MKRKFLEIMTNILVDFIEPLNYQGFFLERTMSHVLLSLQLLLVATR